MEVINNIVKLFPHLFELDSEDRKWYESLEMTEGANMQFDGLDVAAKEFALKHILHPDEHSDAVDECIWRFKDGAFWYKVNLNKLDFLTAEETRKAIDIASILYSEKECVCIEHVDDHFNENYTLDIIGVIKDCFESGVDWASKEIFIG